MKKSLLALAVLGAFAGAASAQVTVYGAVDANYSMIQNTDAAGVESEIRGVRDGAVATAPTRWGIRGSTDLDGGMKANFVLEQGVNLPTGNLGENLSFQRRALVGVSGGFGAINLGREYTPAFNIVGATDPFGTSDYSTVNTNAQTVGARRSNSINYENTFGPIKLQAQYSNEAAKTADVTTASTKGAGVGVAFVSGPLLVGAGYDRGTNLAQDERTEWVVGGTFDLGMAKVFANYINVENDPTVAADTEAREVNLGVSVPMGALTLLAAVGQNEAEVAGGAERDGTDFSVGANYSLAKSTFLYTRVGRTGELDRANREGVSVGIRHSF